MDMQALIEEMSALIVKIKSGTATQGELEAFAAAAGELNERAIILRYKSYEAKVFGTPAAPAAEPQAEIVKNESSVDAPFMAHAETEIVLESESHSDKSETKSENETDDSEVSFDLFSMDDEAEPADVNAPFMAHSDESTSVSEQPISDEVMAHSEAHPIEPVSDDENNPEDGIGAEEEMEAPIIHEDVPGMESTTDETLLVYPEEEIEPAIEHIKNESTADVPFMAHSDESEKSSEPHSEKVKISAENEIPSGDEHPVYKRLSNEDNSLAARLMAVRLETLKGAFGFNERLQIIKELFDGSNDEFTQAIEKLDALDSKNEARHVVSNYARQYAWDKDSNLALEFVQKVERRYA